MRKTNLRGFTLIELLIVIAIIAIISAVTFVALDPLTRFQDSRDAQRWSDVSTILTAIKVDQVDNKGSYLSAIIGLTDGENYMIGTGASGACNVDCDDIDDAGFDLNANCVDLTGLVNEGYLAEVPVGPNGDGTWSSDLTGYVLTATSTGAITITSCESENTTAISVAR